MLARGPGLGSSLVHGRFQNSVRTSQNNESQQGRVDLTDRTREQQVPIELYSRPIDWCWEKFYPLCIELCGTLDCLLDPEVSTQPMPRSLVW